MIIIIAILLVSFCYYIDELYIGIKWKKWDRIIWDS